MEELRLDRPDEYVLPADVAHDDVRFTEQLVEHCLHRYAQPGDVVLDPFAGFGTTAVAAERFGCQSISVELLPERATLIRSRVGPLAQIFIADARELAGLSLPPVDLIITSPPYMTTNEHPEDPLTGYRELNGDYQRYLNELLAVFEQARALLKPGNRAVINVANLSHNGVITPLALDVREVVSTLLTLETEVRILDVDHPSHITEEYCLVFQR